MIFKKVFIYDQGEKIHEDRYDREIDIKDK